MRCVVPTVPSVVVRGMDCFDMPVPVKDPLVRALCVAAPHAALVYEEPLCIFRQRLVFAVGYSIGSAAKCQPLVHEFELLVGLRCAHVPGDHMVGELGFSCARGRVFCLMREDF